MSILDQISKKIKQPQKNEQAEMQKDVPVQKVLPVNPVAQILDNPTQQENKNDLKTSRVLENILNEIGLIKRIIIRNQEQQKTSKDEQVIKPEITSTKRASVALQRDGVRASKKTVKPSAQKATKPSKVTPTKKTPKKTKPATGTPKAMPAPVSEKEPEKIGEGDILGSIVKWVFGGIMAAGGIVMFMRDMFDSLLNGMFGGEDGGPLGPLKTVLEGMMVPIKAVYAVVETAATIVGTVLKEGMLGIGQMWKEAKLLLMSDTLVMKGIRKLLGIEVTDEEKRALAEDVAKGREKREERMKGYIDKIKGEKPKPAPPPAATPQPTQALPTPAPKVKPTGTQTITQARAQEPTVAKPAPTPSIGQPAVPAVEKPAAGPRVQKAAPAPAPAGGAPTPTPTPTPTAAGPAPAGAPTGAPPSTPSAEPAKPPPSPSFQEGKKKMLDAMDKEGIKAPDARAQILAQTAHESGSFKYTQELGNAKYFQRYEGRKDLGNVNPGDGLRYIGRGFLQTTGRVNYQQFKDAYGVDVISDPEKLAKPEYAAESALFWFRKNAKKVQNMSKGNWTDTTAVTRAVNGGLNGLADRLKYYEMFKNDPEVVGKEAAAGAAGAAPPVPGAVPGAQAAPAPAAAAPSSTVASAPAAAPAGGGSISAVTTKQNDGVNISGLNPDFEKRLAAMAADFMQKTGKKLMITSGLRTAQKQKELWDAKLKETGGNVAETRKWVAEPPPPFGNGKVNSHMSGLAIDINARGDAGINVLAGSRSQSTGWLEQFGLVRNVPGEDWHVQLASVPPTPDNPNKPGAPIAVPGKDGAPVNVATGQSAPEPKTPAKSGESVGGNPTSGADLNQKSAEVGSDKADKPKGNVNINVVNAPKVAAVSSTKYS